eukprot:712287-Rhodomonas_salina.1
MVAGHKLCATCAGQGSISPIVLRSCCALSGTDMEMALGQPRVVWVSRPICLRNCHAVVHTYSACRAIGSCMSRT